MCQNKNDILAADTTLGEVVKHGSSTRQLWQGMQFGDIEKVFIPLNISGVHWTLFVSCALHFYRFITSLTKEQQNYNFLKLKCTHINPFLERALK